MLGPVILLLGVRAGQDAENKVRLHHLVSWFIICFFLMIILRSTGHVPDAIMPPLTNLTTLLTIISMAALGLSVDVKSVFAASGRVLATGALSILFLGFMSICAIGLLSL